MRTTTAARATAAKSSKKTTTSGSSGKPTPGKITVTIEGELADEIRKEAEITGMGPLSLARQRIKLGHLVMQESDEAKAFRMEVAERAFRDAGKAVPRGGGKAESSPPAGCGTALVTREDAEWIKEFSKKFESPPWIVASVLAGIGAEMTVSDKAASVIRSCANHQIWKCIHRDSRQFDVEVPCFIDESYNWSDEEVSKAIGRSLPDWMGTLITLGVEVVKGGHDLSFMTGSCQFKLLADAAELRSIKEMEAAK